MPILRAEITQAQMDFWTRKKEEIKMQQRMAGRESAVTNDSMLQGLIDLWMRLEKKDQ